MTSGVGTIEELSNVITGAPFVINGDPNVYAWTGTAGASTSTETTPSSVVRTNLCTNPSFEDGTTGWGVHSATIAQDDEWRTDGGGSESLKVTANAANNDSFAALSTDLTLTSGHTYTISATIRLDGDLLQTGSLSAHARRIYVADTPAFAHTFSSNQAANAAGETRCTVTFTAPTTGTYTVRLYNGSPTAGEAVWWDEVLIEESGSEGTYFDGDSFGFDGAITEPTDGTLLRTNLCTNPSFETNTTSWSASGTGGSISRATSDHVAGTASLQLAQSGSGANVTASYTVTGLTSGQTYTASGYVKDVAGSLTVKVNGGTATTPGSGWQRVSATFVASGTSQVCTFQVIEPGPGAFTKLLDAVQIEAGATATDYFDGATTDTDTLLYAWTGTANASTSTESMTFTEIVSIDTASELDQIILTRDSNPGVLVFEDPHGTLHIFDSDTYRDES